ncbi:MAG TPA: kelch repeat-containing protein [Chitinophagales bacterium]|nr:kelch repeat-containing protein [Chitinophagales bacterium]
MKKNLLFFFLTSIFYLLTSLGLRAQSGQWTWMKGDNTQSNPPVYGTQGIPDSTVNPPSVYEPVEWTDLQGNFWLFGGDGVGSTYADLWMFNVASNNWTWMKGPGLPDVIGIYGTQGVPDALNNPGSRAWGAMSWVDTSGNLWMFGGQGYGTFYGLDFLGELWKYDIGTNEWTWMGGLTQLPNHGTLGVPSPTNYPGARVEDNASWVDADNNLWFFGGISDLGMMNDLWKYEMSSGEWVWMKGSSSAGQSGTYGTKGVENASNVPGCRGTYSKWKDASGNFWMFGGCNYAGTVYNDFWRFNPVTSSWTWMGGNNFSNGPGEAGIKCEDSSDFISNPRYENRASWTDACGNFWLLGGRDQSGYEHNDLWVYSAGQNKWAWVAGTLNANAGGVYGTKGIPDTANHPGARSGNVGWLSADGNLWMFGGLNVNYFNDLWRFTPDSSCLAWLYCSASQFLPAAAFSVTDSSVCAAACLSFTDLSQNNPTSWHWEFPGGIPSSSGVQNPTNICYYTAGTYDVTLIATNAAGSDTIVLANFIAVNAPPSAAIIQSNDTLYSSAGFSYQWYTNGNSISGATNYFYVPSSEDFYSVVITDSNGCNAADTIFFSFAPQTNFSAPDTTICEKFCMDFFDQSTNNPVSWSWNFPGGNPSSSTLQNPSQICYNLPGNYDVMLITTNAFGSDTLLLSGFVTVYSTPPFPSITQVGYTLTSSVADSYQWQFNSVDIPGATNQSYTILQTGYYTVVVSDSNGCVNSSTEYVLISGIHDVISDGNISIYPNPSSGSFMVELINGLMVGDVSIDVVNTLGQIIFSSTESQSPGASNFKKEIDLTKEAQGVYFLKILAESFGKTKTVFATKKIIITK